jgi:uncharacterized protein
VFSHRKSNTDLFYFHPTICFLIAANVAFLLIALMVNEARAEPGNPSFDCKKAREVDERAICNDSRLAELDQAVAIAYSQALKDSKLKTEVHETAKESLAARHSCGDNRICILDQQVKAIDTYSDLGSNVPVPPWVGRYRVELFEADSEPPSKNLPGRIGQCTTTKIASIATRFGDELKPSTELDSSGSAVSYANGGYQVSYSYISALADSHIGDEVLLCLVSIPKNCPPGDDRGKFYSATNLRTKGSWLLPDAQHMCGGA